MPRPPTSRQQLPPASVPGRGASSRTPGRRTSPAPLPAGTVGRATRADPVKRGHQAGDRRDDPSSLDLLPPLDSNSSALSTCSHQGRDSLNPCCWTWPADRRSPATMPGYHGGRPPRNKGRRYPADPPTVEEIVAVMRRRRHPRPRGPRADRAAWRAGLRISEALALAESDLDRRRGASFVRVARAASAARSGWIAGAGSSSTRGSSTATLPIGALFCVINGPTAGRPWSTSAARHS